MVDTIKFPSHTSENYRFAEFVRSGGDGSEQITEPTRRQSEPGIAVAPAMASPDDRTKTAAVTA